MNFEECCIECFKNNELVKQFNKLTGNKLGVNRTPFEKMIDKSCNYNPDEEAFSAFCNFVLEFIWIPLISKEDLYN